MIYCIACGGRHTTRACCPECGACDFNPNIAGVSQCWNCDHVEHV